MKWRALIVDDRQGEEVKDFLETCKTVEPDDEIESEVYTNFDDAISRIHREDCDFVVLDLKDDSIELAEEESLRGKDVMEQIKKTRFVPVIFYTAFPNRVDAQETTFVKVVERGDLNGLENALSDLLKTRLMHLTRDLTEQKREFMWGFVDTHWEELTANEGYREDLAPILANRLANTLQARARETLLSEGGDDSLAHPVEMYIYPPIKSAILRTADVVRNHGAYSIVLTPSCDLIPRKNKNNLPNAQYTLVAKCQLVADSEVGKQIADCIGKNGEPSKKLKDKLERIVRGSEPRYYFLPSVLDELPDLIVDLQQTSILETNEVSGWKRVATLDSPFAEHVLQRFSHYVGRVGTPDLDGKTASERLIALLKADAGAGA